MTISVSRRAVLKGTGAGFAASLFMHTAPTLAAETQAHSGDNEWTGYTICDSCNHMPMCGITFHAKGNTVIRIENWKEHPNHFLCSKGIATLQRLYNPNRLLYPLKRTNPKGSEDPGWVRIGWDEAIKMVAANLNAVKAKYGADRVLFYEGASSSGDAAGALL